ncbi:MAG: ABC transporter permease [Thermoplasmata archaeon]
MSTSTVAPTAAIAADAGPGSSLGRVPDTFQQIRILSGYQLRDYVRSRRFVIMYGIVVAIAVVLTAVLAYFRPLALLASPAALYGTAWGGGVTLVIILAAVFFGGDAIAGEFQNKTGYFLMGQPIRRSAVYSGKFIAAFLASVGSLGLYALLLIANGLYYFGGNALPVDLGESFLLALAYLLAVLGTTFLFSSLFKTSAYGTLLTAILFLFGFTLLQELVSVLAKIEPWFIISYASAVIGNVFANPYPAHVSTTTLAMGRGHVTTVTSYNPTLPEGIVIMILYFVVTGIVGLLLFEREEFT